MMMTIDFWTIAAATLIGILGFVLLVYLLCLILPHIMKACDAISDKAYTYPSNTNTDMAQLYLVLSAFGPRRY